MKNGYKWGFLIIVDKRGCGVLFLGSIGRFGLKFRFDIFFEVYILVFVWRGFV